MPLRLLLVLFYACASVALCPPRCVCSDTLLTVRCASADLARVPSALPSEARTLVITGNVMRALDNGAFNGVRNITHLDLSNNGIMEIGSHSFSSLHSLRSLLLNNNPLTLIHPEAFSVPGCPLEELALHSSLYNYTSLTDLITALRWGKLTNLLLLDLSGNRLVLLPPGMFTTLPSLQHLNLSNNSLMAVYNGTFSGVEQLRKLDLSLNGFKTISIEGLRELERLKSVHLLLSENPFTCACDIQTFASWLNTSKVRVGDVDRLKCEFPEVVRGALLRVVNAQTLGCSGRLQREILELSLQTSYVFLGLVLGFVGMVFLLVVYLNRKGIKKWVTDIHEACRDVLEGYHYRYEIDSDPRLGQVSKSQQGQCRRMDTRLAQVSSNSRIVQIPADVAL
ncbi:hypothetical protein DNTS_000543 [Danionella cerebrum]|uniref:LRRCT domain-containing protein n=1 Tax=Danionella cerebrum TaxID=2873325 RepID=A0A553PU92_9TELE|nr:hypothetical protein DNTS_000543 [Danionella translucida]